MSKKITLIIIIILILILVLAFFFFFFNRGEKSGEITDEDRVGLPPFGSESDSSPFGQSDSVSPEESQTNLGNTRNVPRIRKISFKEVSGFGLFGEDATTTIRYVDRESGNIYESDSESLEVERVTNTTILQTVDSFWIDKDKVVLQYIDENGEIQTFSAEVTVGEEDGNIGTLTGSFMESGINQISVFDEEILSVRSNSSGSILAISDTNLENQSIVLSTPLQEILVKWLNQNTLAINTRPSSESLGHLFLFNIKEGRFNKMVSEKTGLYGIVSSNERYILYSASETRGIRLFVFDTESGEEKEVSKGTLADKCILSKKVGSIAYCAVPKNISFINLPDEWYKGRVSFSDNIWKIDLETNETEIIADFEEEVGESVDIEKMVLSEGENYLAFVNRRDMTLWGIDLSQ